MTDLFDLLGFDAYYVNKIGKQWYVVTPFYSLDRVMVPDTYGDTVL